MFVCLESQRQLFSNVQINVNEKSSIQLVHHWVQYLLHKCNKLSTYTQSHVMFPLRKTFTAQEFFFADDPQDTHPPPP